MPFAGGINGNSYIKAEFAEGATVSLEYDYNYGGEHSAVYDISNGGWAISYLGERYGVVGEEQARTVRVTLGDVEQVYTFYYAVLPGFTASASARTSGRKRSRRPSAASGKAIPSPCRWTRSACISAPA